MGPLPNDLCKWLVHGGLLTTYKSCDDPPSRIDVFFQLRGNWWVLRPSGLDLWDPLMKGIVSL